MTAVHSGARVEELRQQPNERVSEVEVSVYIQFYNDNRINRYFFTFYRDNKRNKSSIFLVFLCIFIYF